MVSIFSLIFFAVFFDVLKVCWIFFFRMDGRKGVNFTFLPCPYLFLKMKNPIISDNFFVLIRAKSCFLWLRCQSYGCMPKDFESGINLTLYEIGWFSFFFLLFFCRGIRILRNGMTSTLTKYYRAKGFLKIIKIVWWMWEAARFRGPN